jgi:hypothetical protein
MDLDGQAVLTLRDWGPLRPSRDAQPGARFVCEDPSLARAWAVPATGFSRKVAANAQETGMNSKKDVKNIRNKPKKSFRINKNAKKRTQNKPKTNSKRTAKTC